MSTRGGARRGGSLSSPKEGFSEALWQWCTSESNNVNNVFKYEGLTRNQACDGSSVTKLASLVTLPMHHQPSMEHAMTNFREAFMDVLRRRPELNESKFQGHRWA